LIHIISPGFRALSLSAMALQKLINITLLQSNRASCVHGIRFISGKALRQVDPETKKLKPFPYETKDFKGFPHSLEKTTYRMDENSKLIVVEGAHAIGKSKFAQELADDLEMKYVPTPRITDMMIDGYGVDLRQYNDLMLPINKTYDEMDFSRNPVGPVEGCADRFHVQLFVEKFRAHVFALQHIFSTGEGVVMESSPYSDYAHFDAAYNQGWIARETRDQYKEIMRMSMHMLMRPNLYIYLDAPVDHVIKNIQNRGNEWDKNSPVWTNKRYLSDIYNELKRNFLKEQQTHSRVLVYDWTEPGDMEIVVEDIEALEFDYLEQWDEQQKDWRLETEELINIERFKFCNHHERHQVLNQLRNTKMNWKPVHLYRDPAEQEHLEDVLKWVKSQRFAFGFNAAMGDKNIVFRGFPFDEPMYPGTEKEQRVWVNKRGARPKFSLDDNDWEGY